MLKVEGGENKVVYSGKQSDEVYQPEGGAHPDRSRGEAPTPGAARRTRPSASSGGSATYNNVCAACHQPSGEGRRRAAFPPLARSDYLNADKARAMAIVTTA